MHVKTLRAQITSREEKFLYVTESISCHSDLYLYLRKPVLKLAFFTCLFGNLVQMVTIIKRLRYFIYPEMVATLLP